MTQIQAILFGLPIASAILTALKQDLDTFIAARQKDRNATFDFGLALARLAQGAAIGAIGGLSAVKLGDMAGA